MKTWQRGFTVGEIVVVIAILGMLASIILFNVSAAQTRSRDADRQADLRTLQSAIELYKQKYGRYPDGCRGAGIWSGQIGTSYACSGGSTQYIVGHVDTTDWDRDGNVTERFGFSPDFIRALPTDKKLRDVNSGYVYTVNTDGTVYKLMARRTVETGPVTSAHPLKSCDTSICTTSPAHCTAGNDTFNTSFAVWGGYAKGANDAAVMTGTRAILCDIP